MNLWQKIKKKIKQIILPKGILKKISGVTVSVSVIICISILTLVIDCLKSF